MKRFSEKFSKKVEAEEKLKKDIMSELSGVSLRKLFNMCDAHPWAIQRSHPTGRSGVAARN